MRHWEWNMSNIANSCRVTMAKEFYFICKCKYIRVFDMDSTCVAGFYWVHHHDGCWRLHSCWLLLLQNRTASHLDLSSCGHHCCASCLLLSGIYGVAKCTLLLLLQQNIVWSYSRSVLIDKLTDFRIVLVTGGASRRCVLHSQRVLLFL